MAIIYFQNNYLTLYYHTAESLGHPIWTGFASGEEHRYSVMECIKLIQEKKPQLWLTDNRKMKAVRQADQDWFTEEIIPILATSSLRKFAVLMSEDIFNQMAVENIYHHTTKINNFEMKLFRDEAAAWAWLK